MDAAQAAYDAWKAENKDAPDTDISNLAAFTAAKAEYKEFVSDLIPLEYKNYTPEQLLALARETSVSGAPEEELAGVTHTGAAGAMYTDITTEYMGEPTFDLEQKEQVAVNNQNLDAAYIHENTGASNGALRYCDNAAYIIYKFDLSKFTNLAVSMELSQNYVLEAAADPAGPWTEIVNYGIISGGIRIMNDTNKMTYTMIFSELGIEGTAYVRLSNVDRAGGWGGAISKLTLSEATKAADTYLFNPGDRVRLEIDADFPEAGADVDVLTAGISNGDYSESASIKGADFAALTEQFDSKFDYSYRTVSAKINLPTAEENAGLADAMKAGGFKINISSAATGARNIYRIALINETTNNTVLELKGQELLAAAAAASTPAELKIMPKAYSSFLRTIGLRSAEGSEWFTIIDMPTDPLDANGEPFMHPGDEIEYSVDLFYEGSDVEDLPGNQNGPRVAAKLNVVEDDTSVGIVDDADVVVNTTEYNENEFGADDLYDGEMYKTITRTFTVPDDEEIVNKVQTTGFKLLVGTHLAPKEDYPFVVYSMTFYNITTDTVILYANADDLKATSYQGTREEIVHEGVIGGIKNTPAPGYGQATLVNGGFDTLAAGMYSYAFDCSTMGEGGADKAKLSAVTEDGTVLASTMITENTNNRFKNTRLLFSVTEETKVGFKVETFNHTTFSLRGVTLNQMLSASEVAIQKVINAINALPAVEELELSDAKDVESARKAFDRLTEEEQAKVENIAVLEAAEDKIEELKAQEEADKAKAKEVDDAINALPAIKALAKTDKDAVEGARAKYTALTEAQKAHVTALETLEAVEARLAKLLAASDEDIAAAKAADDKIDAIPALDALTYADQAKVEDARKAYDALSEGQKALVLGLATLEAAEEKMATLEPEVLYGDVNNDKKVDATDALWVLQHSVELRTLTETELKAADVTDLGKVDTKDALQILQKTVDLIDQFDVEKQ